MWADSDQVGDMRTRTTVSAAAVAAVMALTVGACGGSKPFAAPSSTAPATTPPSGTKVLLASIRTTAAAKSAHMSMTVGTDGSGPLAFSMTADGAVDFTTGDSQFTAQLDGAAASFLPDGIEMRMVDGVAYMKLPASLGGLLGGSGGEQWMSLSIPKGGAAGAGAFSGVDQSDPTQFLAALQKISDDVTEVGKATVRGVETTQYHATLDLGKSVDNADLPPALRDKVKGFLGNAPAIPVDVFVDSDGRVRRMTMTMDLGSFMAGVSGASGATGIGELPTMNVTVDFYDFGAPVHVEAPPADQIIKMPKLGDLGGFGDLGDLGGPGASSGGGNTA